MASNPRRTNGSRRDKLRRRVAAEGRPCAICGEEIDYELKSPHPDSYELDEIVPVSKGGSPYEYSNVQPTHRRCNRAKGASIALRSYVVEVPDQIEHSREW